MENLFKKINHNLKGQILVIILIVMLVLGITVITVTNNVIRDISQSKQNTQYESLYSTAEKHVLNIAQSLPSDNVTPTNVQTTLEDSGFDDVSCDTADDDSPDSPSVICSVTDPTNPVDDAELQIKVKDSPHIIRAVLAKDEIIAFKLNGDLEGHGQTLDVTMEGEGDIAIEVILDFKYNGASEYNAVRGVYDRNLSVFTNLQDNVFDMPITGTGDGFYIDYDSLKSNIASSYLANFTTGDPGDIELLQFRFRPIIKTGDPNSMPTIYLSVINSDTNFNQAIMQSRVFDATSYVMKDGKIFGSQAFATASLPLHKYPSILDYVLRSHSDLTHFQDCIPTGNTCGDEASECCSGVCQVILTTAVCVNS
ncbi:hypothetical protein GF362_05205 [Candidatus Dojkabacteria bacterium]|nr:hypothetical protein [Candidatus Dojkabacteria bacterium]